MPQLWIVGLPAIAAVALATPAAAQQRVTSADCRAEQAAMRQLGMSEPEIAEALRPPGVADADSTAESLALFANSFQQTLATAERYDAKQDAATFRVILCAYRVAIQRIQGARSSAPQPHQPATPPRTAPAPPVTTNMGNRPGGFVTVPTSPPAPLKSLARTLPAAAKAVQPPRLLTPGLIQPGDYPVASMRAGEEGQVGVTVTVTASGAPSACRVIESSGFAGLDQATCPLVVQRARFEPARNAAGRAVPGEYSTRIAWLLG